MENIVKAVAARIAAAEWFSLEDVTTNDNANFCMRRPEGIENYDVRTIAIREVLKDTSDVDGNVRDAMMIICKLGRIKPFWQLHVLPSFEVKGQFSYSRENEDGDAKRVRTSFGRIMRRQFKITPDIIKDDVLAKINDILLRKIWNLENMAKEVKGRDITRAYENYTGESCMSNGCAEYVEMYAKNPNKVSLIITEDNQGNCVSKALLWKTDDGKLILDRVYYDNGRHMDSQGIISYAKQKGADVASNAYTGRAGDECGQVTLDISGCEYLPYMDTFAYAGNCEQIDGKSHARFCSESNPDMFCCDSVDGYHGIVNCPECGKTSINGSGNCGYCEEEVGSGCDEDCEW